MKTTISLATILSVLLLMSFNAQAQNDTGDISVGAGIGYGFDLEEIGINVNGYYSITPEIRAGLDILYYLVDSPDGVDFTAWELNINGHYLFVNDNDLRLYGLAGINYFSTSSSADTEFGSFSISGSTTGFNLGAGVEYDFGGVGIYAEPRLALNSGTQFVLSAGARFTF